MAQTSRKPELLIPANSLEVLKIAVIYGADAVYVGGEAYGLRAKARNFSMEELREGIAFAHEHGVRVYVTANILEAFEQNGKIYAMPTRIGLPVIIGTDDVIANADELNKLASYCNQAKLPYYVEGTVTYNTIIENFYPLYINSIMENEEVNQIKLREFLSSIKMIADSVGAVEASDFDNSRPVRWLGLGNTSFATAVIRGMLYDQATEVLSYAKQRGDYIVVDDLFMPYGLLGVNENGEQKELAEQFILEALDIQVQQVEYLGAGFPVTNSALEIWRDKESDRGGAVSVPNTGSEIISSCVVGFFN